MNKCLHYFIVYLTMNTNVVDGILHLKQLVWSQRLLQKFVMTLEACESQPWLTSSDENLEVPKGRTTSICTIFSFLMESLRFWGSHLHIHEHNFFGNAHPSHYTLLIFSKLYCNQMARQARNLGLFVSMDEKKIHAPFVTRIIMVENIVLGLINYLSMFHQRASIRATTFLIPCHRLIRMFNGL